MSGIKRTLLLRRLVQQARLVVEGRVDFLDLSGHRRKLQPSFQELVSRRNHCELTISDAAFTLSTAPIWSAQMAVCLREGRDRYVNVRLTTLDDVGALLRELDVHHVSKTFLGVVRDRHGTDLGLVIVNDRFVVFGVPLR